MVAGKKGGTCACLATPGSSQSSHHFICDQQGSVAARDFPNATQPSGWLRNHSRRALNQRLENESRIRIFSFFVRFEFLLELADAFPIALPIFPGIGAFGLRAIERASIAIRRSRGVSFEEQGAITFM